MSHNGVVFQVFFLLLLTAEVVRSHYMYIYMSVVFVRPRISCFSCIFVVINLSGDPFARVRYVSVLVSCLRKG